MKRICRECGYAGSYKDYYADLDADCGKCPKCGDEVFDDDFTQDEYDTIITPAIVAKYAELVEKENNSDEFHKCNLRLEVLGMEVVCYEYDTDKEVTEPFEDVEFTFTVNYERVLHDEDGYHGTYEQEIVAMHMDRTPEGELKINSLEVE